MSTGKLERNGLNPELIEPQRTSGGDIRGVVQVWLWKAGRRVKLEYAKRWTLTKPADQDACLEDLDNLGVKDASSVLMSLLSAAEADAVEVADTYVAPPKPSTHAGTGEWFVEELTKPKPDGKPTGLFLVTHTGHPYYTNGTSDEPLSLDDEGFAQTLWRVSNHVMNSAHPAAGHVTAHLNHYAKEFGQLVTLHKFSYYDRERGLLYVNCGAGSMVRLDGKTVTPLRNGEDGVQFIRSDNDDPWEYREDHGSRYRADLVNTYSFAEGTETPFTIEQQRLMFLVWVLSFFFKTELPTRPLTVCFGPKGSGKTAAVQDVGRILFGPRFKTTPIDADKQKNFWVAAAARPYLAIDNNDDYIRWFQDAVAQIATGTEWAVAELYKTGKLVSYDIDTFLAITTRTPKFLRDDVSDRTLFFLFQRLEASQRIGERRRELMLMQHRDAYMSELVDRVNKVLATKPPEIASIPIRMADFAEIAMWIGESLGLADEVYGALTAQASFQAEMSTGDDAFALLRCIRAWITRNGPGGIINTGRYVTASVLHGELLTIPEVLDKEGFPAGIKKPNWMGRRLIDAFPTIETEFDYEIRDGRIVEYAFWPKGAREEVGDGQLL